MQTLNIISNQIDKTSLSGFPEVKNFVELCKLLNLDANLQKVKSKDSFFGSGRNKDSSPALEVGGDQKLHSAIEIISRTKKKPFTIVFLNVEDPKQKSLFVVCLQNLIKAGVKVMITGPTEEEIMRLQMKPDPKFQNAPPYETHKKLYDYLRTKITGEILISRMASGLLEYDFLPEEVQKKLQILLSHTKKQESILKDHTFLYHFFAFYDINSRYEGYFQDLVELMFHPKVEERKFFSSIGKFLFGQENFPLLKKEADKIIKYDSVRIEKEPTSVEEIFDLLTLYFFDFPKDHPALRVLPSFFQNLLFKSRLRNDWQVLSNANFLRKRTKEENQFIHSRLLFLNQIHQVVGANLENSRAELDVKIKQNLIEDFYGNYATVVNYKQEKLKGGQSNKKNPGEQKMAEFCVSHIEQKSHEKLKQIFDRFYDPKRARQTNILSILQRLKMTEGECRASILREASKLLPEFEMLMQFKKKIGEELQNQDTDLFKETVSMFFKSSIKTFPFYAYVLTSSDDIPIENKIIYRSAKKQLGILSYKKISEPIPESQIKNHSFPNLIKVDSSLQVKSRIQLPLVFESYDSFLRANVEKNIERFTLNRVDLLYRHEGENTFYYLYNRFLFETELFIGYHDFYKILQQIHFTSKNQLLKYGYNPLFKQQEEWLKDPFFELEELPDEYKESGVVGISKNLVKQKKEFFRYVNLVKHSASKQSARDVEWLTVMFKKLNSMKQMNLFSDEFRALLKNNSYINSFWNFVTEFLYEEMQNFKNYDDVQLYVNDDFRFLTFFDTERTIEINYETLNVRILHAPQEKLKNFGILSNKFQKYLNKINKDADVDSGLANLRRIHKIIFRLQEKWARIQQTAAFLLVNEIVAENIRYYVQSGSKPIQVNELKNKHKDQEKLFVCAHTKMLENVEFRQLFQKFDPTSPNLVILSHFNQQLNNIFALEKECKHYSTLFFLVNRYMSALPHVRYAPKDLKIFRSDLHQLTLVLQRSEIQLSAGELEKIEQYCRKLKTGFLDIISREVNFPLKARFMNLALSRLKSRRSLHEVDEFVNFFKKIPAENSQGETEAAKSESFTVRLQQAIAFRNFIGQKKVFFFFPYFEQFALLKDTISILKTLNGFTTEIYVDDTSLHSIKKRIAEFVHPAFILPLKDQDKNFKI